MTLYYLKIYIALSVLVITILSGWYPLRLCGKMEKVQTFPIAEAIASGVFLGASMMHMLHEAVIYLLEHHIYYPWPFLLAGTTFLLLLWFEHLGQEFYCHQDIYAAPFAVLAVVMLSMHALFAGAAIGVSSNWSLVLVIALAVFMHKWIASFALAVEIRRSMLTSSIGIVCFGIFAMMTPLGIFLGSLITSHIENHIWLMPVFSSLAAGTFLYLGTLHGLKRAVMVEYCCNLKHFSFVIVGFALMAIVAVIL